MRTLKFGHRTIGDGQPCFVIAEVGINHNGQEDLAHRMVDAIADAGADCVKFQTFSAEEFMNGPDQQMEYVSQGQVVRESMLAMFKRYELQSESFSRLFEHARARGLVPLSTPTDTNAVDLLDRIGIGGFKIGSDDLVYTPFLEYVARKGKPIILSTGMADAADIERAVSTITKSGNDRIVILHCVSVYPTPDEDVNLLRVRTLRDQYPGPIGYSDHSAGIVAALGAVSLGASVIEKHFTIDKDLPGPDHHFSADPSELRAMVQGLRALEAQMGSPRLRPARGEAEMAAIARRSIVANRDLPKGHVVAPEDLSYRRPGTGLMPYERDRLIGRRTRQAVGADTQFTLAMVE
ncbi:MAG: N-acetylneuraminate synthase [Alphaproteobacteria bacterium]|nr:N-acetylneuraminate synthase [Alphaproteobacteria bacterium]